MNLTKKTVLTVLATAMLVDPIISYAAAFGKLPLAATQPVENKLKNNKLPTAPATLKQRATVPTRTSTLLGHGIKKVPATSPFKALRLKSQAKSNRIVGVMPPAGNPPVTPLRLNPRLNSRVKPAVKASIKPGIKVNRAANIKLPHRLPFAIGSGIRPLSPSGSAVKRPKASAAAKPASTPRYRQQIEGGFSRSRPAASATSRSQTGSGLSNTRPIRPAGSSSNQSVGGTDRNAAPPAGGGSFHTEAVATHTNEGGEIFQLSNGQTVPLRDGSGGLGMPDDKGGVLYPDGTYITPDSDGGTSVFDADGNLTDHRSAAE